jgi:HK97 gp10 family phage protein
MADGISIDVQGLSAIQAQLDGLTKEAGERAIRKALRAGAAVEKAAIEERAPVKDVTGGILPAGALRADITVRMSRDEQGTIIAIVGPGKLTKWVCRLVEYGHRLVRGGSSRVLANGKTRGAGKVLGQVDPHPFIRPAYEASQQAVANAICTTLATEVEREAKRK